MMKRAFCDRYLPLLLGIAVVLGAMARAAEPAPIDKLLEQLGADEFAVRQSAQEELVEWGKKDLRERLDLFQAKQTEAVDPEVRERCRAIVKELAMIWLDQNRPGFIGIEMGGVRLGPGDKLEGLKEKLAGQRGVHIAGVRPETAAEKFGLKAEDLILKIDDVRLHGAEATDKLVEYVGGKLSGTEIQIHIERDGEELTIPLTLMARPRQLDRQLVNPFNGFSSSRLLSEEELREKEYENWLRERKKGSQKGR